MKVLCRVAAALGALALILVFGAAKTTELQRFRDVAAGSGCYEAAEWAVENGLASPTSEEEFSPNWTLTRAELAGYFYRFAYQPEPSYTCLDSLYAGQPDAWYYAPMHWCADWGMLAPETREDYPAGTASRDEAVVMLYHYAEAWERRPVAAEGDHLTGYSDAPKDPDSRAAWNWAAARGLLNEGSSLRPDSPVTRGEIVTLLYRYQTVEGAGAKALRCRSLCGVEARGWQRLLLETAELALGADWEDGAYELGSDGVPTVIDCSGYVNWMFTSSGLHPYDDLECKPLWDADVFQRVDARRSNETGAQFWTRMRNKLKLGDLLLVHRDKNSGYHIMVYICPAGDGVCALQSLDYQGVDYYRFEADSYYLQNLYGVLRFCP